MASQQQFFSITVWSPVELAMPEHGILIETGSNSFCLVTDRDVFVARMLQAGIQIRRMVALQDGEDPVDLPVLVLPTGDPT